MKLLRFIARDILESLIEAVQGFACGTYDASMSTSEALARDYFFYLAGKGASK